MVGQISIRLHGNSLFALIIGTEMAKYVFIIVLSFKKKSSEIGMKQIAHAKMSLEW